MIDDILLQEIQSLKEQLRICIKIVKYYEPNLDESKFWHDISTCDYQDYLKELEVQDNEV